MPGLWWTRSCLMRNTHRPSVRDAQADDASASASRLETDNKADLGLQVLDNVIVTIWKVLPREQCQGSPFLSILLV